MWLSQCVGRHLVFCAWITTCSFIPDKPDMINIMGLGYTGHLARPLKTFDPFFTEKEIVKNQILDFGQFLDEVDMVVVMVKHDHIKQNWDKLKGKVILDCFNVCPLDGVYHM